MRTLIKLCGFTNIKDIEFATSLNIDYLGMIFVSGSPRCIDNNVAQEAVLVCKQNNVKSVGVFLNHSPAHIKSVLDNVDLDVIQLHGTELIDDYTFLSKEIIKTIHMNSYTKETKFDSISNCTYLADYTDKDMHGGTGSSFDWGAVDEDLFPKIFIAGGLTPDNILNLLRNYNPKGVDTSSGIEKSIGLKNHNLINQFVSQIREYDEEKN